MESSCSATKRKHQGPGGVTKARAAETLFSSSSGSISNANKCKAYSCYVACPRTKAICKILRHPTKVLWWNSLLAKLMGCRRILQIAFVHNSKRAAIILKPNRRRFVTHPTFLQNGLAAGLKLAPISVPYILPRLFAPSTTPCSPATNLGCFTTSGYITSIFLFQSVWPTVKQGQTSRIMGGSVQY